jgi:hypothetical protein
MQPCNRIYYSKIYWRLNMFRAAHRLSSGTPNCICSLWFIYCLMMSGMPLEICWAFNKFWNNKFYYKVASCWLFLPIHTTMHESMNIKKKFPNLRRRVQWALRRAGAHKTYNNLTTNWKLLQPKRWHAASSIIRAPEHSAPPYKFQS